MALASTPRQLSSALPLSASSSERARRILAAMPGRVTTPRIQVVACLMETTQPLSHGELQVLLPQLNRVSLYRCLDWLEEQGLCIRLNDSTGVRRYAWQEQGQHDHHQHAHFQCQHCGRTECLEAMTIPKVRLPSGYQADGITMLVTGTCHSCHGAGASAPDA